MSGKSPRLSVSLTPSLVRLFNDLAEVSEQSASSLVRELLEQSEPALSRMLELFRAAKAAKGSISAGLGGALDRVVDDLQDAVDLADVRLARASRDLVAEAESVRGRRRSRGGRGATGAAPATALTPVPVTRGSGSGKTRKAGGRRGGRT